MRNQRTLFVLFAALIVGGANIAAAQQKLVRTFQMHVSPEEEVWNIAPAQPIARDIVLQLGRQLRWDGLDCSHLVHDIYERAGLPYDYATSRDLYDGVDAFRRVYHPQAGDIIVWRGHVGIVVDPEQRSFLSALRSGVKVSVYDTNYWKRRGHPRFYRYALQGNEGPDWSASDTRRASLMVPSD